MKAGNSRLVRGAAVLACVAVLVTAFVYVKWGDIDPVRFLCLVAVLAFFESWMIHFPWGRPLRLGVAVTLCVVAVRPLPEALWIFLLGSLAGRVVSRRGGGDFFHLVQRINVLAAAGLLYRLVVMAGWNFTWNPYPAYYVAEPTAAGEYFTYFNPAVLHRALVFPAAFLVLAAVFYAGEVLTSSLETTMTTGGSWRVTLPQHLRQTFPVYLALAASGGLMALYFPRIPWLNFLVFLFPLFLVRLESNRDKELDDRYFQTMRVIGDAFDVARGLPGHSSRVSNLAAEVAREMGLSTEEIRRVRYAAALHDVGWVEFEGEKEAPGHARSAAEVLDKIPRLRPVAELVRHHHDAPGESVGTARIPVGSKIIGAVSDYDLLTGRPGSKVTPREALKEMSLERGKKYDSKVLRVLAQVVELQAKARRRPEREIRQKAKVLEEEELRESLEEIFGREE